MAKDQQQMSGNAKPMADTLADYDGSGPRDNSGASDRDGDLELGWRPIETAPQGKTVLTQHYEDLYPMPAYRLVHYGQDLWLRETEGPEDGFYGGGRHEPLYRHPTHWMPLPDPPHD